MSERYADIISRLERATGADRELDGAIYNLMPRDAGWIAFKVRDWSKPPGARLDRCHDGWLVGRHEFDEYAEKLPRYTASLDAAIGLVERLAPEFCRSTGTRGNGAWQPGYWAECGPYRKPVDTTHASEPIALLLALFKALQAQEPK